jgi:hypothetical protein
VKDETLVKIDEHRVSTVKVEEEIVPAEPMTLVLVEIKSHEDPRHDKVLTISHLEGKTYRYIKEHHRDFCEWAVMRRDPQFQLKEFVDYLKEQEDGHWSRLYRWYHRSDNMVLFGKYKGQTYEQTATMDWSYCERCLYCETPCQAMADFTQWLETTKTLGMNL